MAWNEDFKFEITKHIADLTEPTEKGWRMELNEVSWNDKAPTLDIRNWNEDHTKSSKVGTFSKEALKNLRKVLGTLDLD